MQELVDVNGLFGPRSVALVGASGDLTKATGLPMAFLLRNGYAGKIFPVNPRVQVIEGYTCYPDVASLPEAPEVAMVLLGAERAEQAVRDLALRGTKFCIVLAGGFGEVGEEGARRQEALVRAKGAMRLVGPNTIGLANINDGLALTASSSLESKSITAGSVSVISQSGGIMGSLLSRASARGIGLAKLVSTSNEVDLELSDFIATLAGDEHTKVIALYIETIRHPQRFIKSVRLAQAAGKSIVAFKVGRSEGGARAAVSHTGAMAGSDAMYDAFFEFLGIVRAQQFGDLLDIASGLATDRQLKGKRVAILTSTGGAGTLVADALGVAGFETPNPDATTGAALRALQNGEHAAMDRNPIDVTLSGLQPAVLRGSIAALMASDCYDALVVIAGSSALAQPELLAGAMRDCLSLSNKPVVAYVSPHAVNVQQALNLAGVPAFMNPEGCALALSAMQSRQRVVGQNIVDTSAHDDARSWLSGALDEAQSKALFASWGIPGANEVVLELDASKPQALEELKQTLGDTVVLKVLSNKLLHKSEVGGVRLSVPVEGLGDAMRAMSTEVLKKSGLQVERFLAQAMVQGGVEMLLGLKRDALGAALVLGMGGITAELMGDVSLRYIPEEGELALTKQQALAMCQCLKTWPLLDGYRGKPVVDVNALCEALVAFANMIQAMGERLQEAEINPLFVMPLHSGGGVVAADGLAVLR